MAVGSVDLNAERSTYSAMGSEVEVVAPGEMIPAIDYLDSVFLSEGTSMSAAEVTGVASVLWSLDKNKSAEFIRKVIRESANDLGDKESYGNGMVDLESALFLYKNSMDEEINILSEEIMEDSREVEVVSEEEVLASWTKELHTGILDDSEIQKGTTAYKVVTQGLIFPDKYRFDMPTGTWKNLNGNANYMADYLYLIRLARKSYLYGLSYAKANTIHPLESTNPQNASECKTMVKTYFDNMTEAGIWKTALCCDSVSDLTTTERYHRQGQFILGMAIHTAMDAFAHRWVIEGIDYDGSEADGVELDNPEEYTKKQRDAFALRYTVAKRVALGAVTQWKGEHDFGIIQFHKEKAYTKGTFYMKKFKQYAKNTEASVYQNYQSYFDDRDASVIE